jgi:ATP-binding cassette subfamily F protein 3
MRLLSGTESTDSGQLKLGHKVEVRFFSQERFFNLDENKTVLENLMEAAQVSLVPQLRTILGAFLFHGDDVDKKANVLSGGEESRLALAKMLLQPANTLLLDEPTNHLDIDSKEVLLHALKSYKGTLVFVSHDRYFIDSLANKVIEVGEGKTRMYWGNYEDYLHAKAATLEPGAEQVSEDKPHVPAKDKPRSTTSKNQARRLREELSRVEESTDETETAIASLEGRMSVAGFYDDADAAAKIVETHEALKKKLEALYEEWETLAAKQEETP